MAVEGSRALAGCNIGASPLSPEEIRAALEALSASWADSGDVRALAARLGALLRALGDGTPTG